MRMSVNPQIFTDFNNPRVAVAVVSNLNNRADMSEFNRMLSELSTSLQDLYGDIPISQLPKIAAWREAYRVFGVKAKDYPSSVEALCKRVARGADIAGINPLVDIYNYICLKYMLPVGGEDTDKMRGDLQLTYAAADEQPVTVLGKDAGAGRRRDYLQR